MEISRRNFIKASGGLAAFGMIGTGSLNRWIRPAAAEGAEEEKIAYTFHPPNCGGRCSMKCTVRKGKLVKIEPNEWPDGHHKKVCLRGLSEVERVYSPDRLKTPLKRVGERGEGKFVAISWDEALTTIADKLTEIKGKSDFQIEKELAQKLGLDQYLPETPEDYVRALLNSPDPALQGITVEALKANQCIMRLNVPDQPYVAYLDRVFGTESTKLEFYNELFLEDHCAFPVWEEPNEASPANPLYQKYPLMLGSPHARFRAHSTFSNARWLLQINNEPLVRINPIDAQARGIQNREFVEVFNDRGSFQCRCQIVNDMRPGMVQLSEGWWSRYFQKGDLQEVTNPNKNPRGKKLLYGPIVAFLDTLVEVKKVEG